MDPFEGLVEPTDPFSEKCNQMHKTELVRYIEFNEIF